MYTGNVNGLNMMLSYRTQAKIVKKDITVGVALGSSCLEVIHDRKSGVARSRRHKNRGDRAHSVVWSLIIGTGKSQAVDPDVA